MVSENPKPISEIPTQDQVQNAKDKIEAGLMALSTTNSVGVGLYDEGDIRKRAIVVTGQYGEILPAEPNEIDGVKVIFRDSSRAKSQKS